jgi:hypothetical protein
MFWPIKNRRELMENLDLIKLIPWALVGGLIFIFSKLTTMARKASKVAIAVGVLMQMFTPDPKVEQTIQMVVKQKQQAEAQQKQGEVEGEGDKDEEHHS